MCSFPPINQSEDTSRVSTNELYVKRWICECSKYCITLWHLNRQAINIVWSIWFNLTLFKFHLRCVYCSQILNQRTEKKHTLKIYFLSWEMLKCHIHSVRRQDRAESQTCMAAKESRELQIRMPIWNSVQYSNNWWRINLKNCLKGQQSKKKSIQASVLIIKSSNKALVSLLIFLNLQKTNLGFCPIIWYALQALAKKLLQRVTVFSL